MKPALHLVPLAGEELPLQHEVKEKISSHLENAGWDRWHDSVLAIRTETREIQDEVPPADPVDITVVTVILEQQHVTERYRSPFEVVLECLQDEFGCEVWIGAGET